MYEFVVLNGTNTFQYDRLTYPTFRPRLRIIKQDRSLVAIGIHFEQTPVGLILAEFLQHESIAEILSVFVVPEHRGQGLGKALLNEMEQYLRQHNCSKMHLVYIPNSTTLALEKILHQQEWHSSQPRMLICTGTPDAIQKASWLKLDAMPDSNYTMFPWLELTLQERQDILTQQAESGWYPDILSPFKEEAILEPLNSLGLRYQNQVVGWMITHCIAPDTIRYTSLFVKKELQSIGRAIPLLATAINTHVQHRKSHQAVFTVDMNNEPMMKFVQRRLAPYLVSIRQSMQTCKVLQA
ncbi:GNAT family N-acetyltransferase [Nostoc sp. FACHB-973]|nr:GNAT family N-acetyltransferase [Nostoc sp. FACHB-973]